MYNGLNRQRGETKYAAGASARRRIRVEEHSGSYLDYEARLMRDGREAAHGIRKEEFLQNGFRYATDARLLYRAWELLKRGGGHAPGIDDLSYSDVPEDMAWKVLDGLQNSLRSGTYQPSPLRPRSIPKAPSSSGAPSASRLLELPTVFDRTVGKATTLMLTPFLDPQFDDRSFGYRPHRDRTRAVTL